MKNSTLVFPGFHLRTLRRKPRSAQQIFAEKIALLKRKSFKQMGEVFKKFIPRELLKPDRTGVMSRQRIFSKENTFWAFSVRCWMLTGVAKRSFASSNLTPLLKGSK